MLCYQCLCDSCINNVDTITSTQEERISSSPCFNCDECYWYGMDNNNLTKNQKSKCENYRITSYKAELKRNILKVIK